jgi:predicted nucleic acid-binding protein
MSPKNMGFKIFLDTNIVLDILDDKRPFHSTAIELYQLIEENELDAYISETVLATTDYILQKKASKETRTGLLTELIDFLQIVSCNNKTCRKALQSNFSDLEDAILYYMAVDHSLDYFISNDKRLKKFSIATLPVLSTKEFLNING